MLPFDRPDNTGPNRELFQLDKSTQQPLKTNFRTQGIAPSLAMPTNAWYQNLLLAHGEPSEEQRAYPVPYVVDLVGPIPGVRLHHPNVQGGATIIQLNQVLEHGLTIGSSSLKYLLGESSINKKKKRHHHDDDDDDDQVGEKPQAVSKKYAITKMTPLGITLEWVSTIILIADRASIFFSYQLILMRFYRSFSIHCRRIRQVIPAYRTTH